jgi:flagellar motor switch protein FliM
MPPTLTKSEVDALMDALQDGRIDTSTANEVDASQPGVKKFDLTSRDRIVRGRMPTLDAINGRIARAFSQTLSNLMRGEIEVISESALPMKLGEFLSYQPTPACINLISITPLQGTSLLCIQPDLFYNLLNVILGGAQTQVTQSGGGMPNRDFTAIEMDFARLLVDAWNKDTMTSWAEVFQLQPSYLHTEVTPTHIAVGAASEVFMSTTFQVRLNQTEGKIEFAIPYASLEPLKPQLIEHHMEETAADRKAWQDRLRAALMPVPVRMRVELGRIPIELSRLISLNIGDVVRLDRHPNSLLQLQIALQPKGLVSPLEINGNLGFEFKDWRNHER